MTEYLCYNGPIGNGDQHNHLKVKLGISGAAETGFCGPHALDLAKELGREIIRQGGVLVTGATTGFPLWTAMGAKEEHGMVIGFSPASSEREHAEVYHLPLDYADIIVYTGFGYPGRDLLFTRSTDAMFFGCGRIGTIHEFTIAFEDGKPMGVLDGPWDMDKELRMILDKGHRENNKVVFDADPKRLVEKVMAMVKEDKLKEFELVKTKKDLQNMQ